MEVHPDFKNLFELFNAHKVEYMIVGVMPWLFIGHIGRKKDEADLEALGQV